MKICITGAASKVARKVIDVLAQRHELTLLDVQYPQNFFPDVRKVTGSVLDRKLMREVLNGQDAVIHMAIAHEDSFMTDEQRWTVNVEGTLLVVQESAAAGIKKFIYTSSLSVLDGYDHLPEAPGAEEVEPKQNTFYGLTKHLGELMVKFYAEKHKIKSVVLRLVAVVAENEDPAWLSRVSPIYRTSARDVAQAFQLALEKDLNSYCEIFHISGGNPKRRWGHEKAKRVLGYEPLDTWEEKQP